MGLLDGGLADSIYASFQNKLLTAQYTSYAPPTSGGLDELGDPTDVGESPTPCQGFIDLYSAVTAKLAGIPETDLQVCLFGPSMPGVTPVRDGVVKITGPAGSIYVNRFFQIRKVAIDPAGALWTCQSFEITDPAA